MNDEEGKIKGYPQGSFSSKFPLTVMTNIVTCRPPQGKKITKIQGRSDIFAPIGLIEMICCFKGPELLGGGGVPSTSKAAAFSCCKRTLTRANYTKQYPHIKSQKLGKYF